MWLCSAQLVSVKIIGSKTHETVEEILACSGFSENSEQEPTLAYENIFSDNIQEVIKVAIGLKKKLKARKKIIDDKG